MFPFFKRSDEDNRSPDFLVIQSNILGITIAVVPFDGVGPSSFCEGFTVTLSPPSCPSHKPSALIAIQHLINAQIPVAKKYENKGNRGIGVQNVCLKDFCLNVAELPNSEGMRFSLPTFFFDANDAYKVTIKNAWECLYRISEINSTCESPLIVISQLAAEVIQTVSEFDALTSKKFSRR